MSDKRVVLGKLANNNYGLQISKAGVDVIDDTINSQDYLFNSEVYRAGTIRSNSEYSKPSLHCLNFNFFFLYI